MKKKKLRPQNLFPRSELRTFFLNPIGTTPIGSCYCKNFPTQKDFNNMDETQKQKWESSAFAFGFYSKQEIQNDLNCKQLLAKINRDKKFKEIIQSLTQELIQKI